MFGTASTGSSNSGDHERRLISGAAFFAVVLVAVAAAAWEAAGFAPAAVFNVSRLIAFSVCL
jgi:hypothetical protein